MQRGQAAAGEAGQPQNGREITGGAAALHGSCEAVFARHADEMRRLDIDHGYLIATVGSAGILLEPVLYWPEARMLLQPAQSVHDFHEY